MRQKRTGPRQADEAGQEVADGNGGRARCASRPPRAGQESQAHDRPGPGHARHRPEDIAQERSGRRLKRSLSASEEKGQADAERGHEDEVATGMIRSPRSQGEAKST
jgi:hypothetical protein